MINCFRSYFRCLLVLVSFRDIWCSLVVFCSIREANRYQARSGESEKLRTSNWQHTTEKWKNRRSRDDHIVTEITAKVQPEKTYSPFRKIPIRWIRNRKPINAKTMGKSTADNLMRLCVLASVQYATNERFIFQKKWDPGSLHN